MSNRLLCSNAGNYLLDYSFQEVDSDGLLVIFGENTFAEALDHAGLADGAISDDHHLYNTNHSTANET